MLIRAASPMEAEVERALTALLAEEAPFDYAAVRDRVTPAQPVLPEFARFFFCLTSRGCTHTIGRRRSADGTPARSALFVSSGFVRHDLLGNDAKPQGHF
jgi:hypothetical protein